MLIIGTTVEKLRREYDRRTAEMKAEGTLETFHAGLQAALVGDTCPSCGGMIVKMPIGHHGNHTLYSTPWCERCQRVYPTSSTEIIAR